MAEDRENMVGDNTQGEFLARLKQLLDSPHSKDRSEALKLAACRSIESLEEFGQLFPIFMSALNIEDWDVRCLALAILTDLAFVHADEAPEDIAVHCSTFLFSPNWKAQVAAAIGVGRILLYESCGEYERLLGAMLKRYTCKESHPTQQRNKIHQVLETFFSTYSAGGKKHQDELLNTVVHLLLEALETRALLPSRSGKLEYNADPILRQNVELLHCSVKLALGLAGSCYDFVAQGLCANASSTLEVSLDERAVVTWLSECFGSRHATQPEDQSNLGPS